MPFKITATGMATPALSIENRSLEKIVDTTDEWIYTRSGIRSRYIAADETADSLAVEAAKNCLQQSGLAPEDIGLIIASSATARTVVPCLAAKVRQELGIQQAVTFDINAACTGFIYGLTTAQGLMQSLGIRHALIVAGEAMSQMLDWEDRSTCVLFGDGAGAAILSQSEAPGVLWQKLQGEEDPARALRYSRAYHETPFSKEGRKLRLLKMKGKSVFQYAVNEMARLIQKAVTESGVAIEEIQHIIPHQANIRMIESTAKRFEIDLKQFYMNIDHFGNTSSASIPIALHELHQSGKLTSGEKVLLLGFGAGFTSGAILLEW